MQSLASLSAAAAALLSFVPCVALPAQSIGCHDLSGIAPIAQSLVAASPAFGTNAVRLDQPAGLVYEQRSAATCRSGTPV